MTDTAMTTGSPEELAQRCGMAAGVSLDPQGGPALATDDGESLTGSFESVSLVLGDADQGPGVLFVTNRYHPQAEPCSASSNTKLSTIAHAVVPRFITCVAQQLGCHRGD